MTFFVAKSTVHKSLISSSSAILIVIFSDYLTLFINPMFNVNVGEYTRFFYTVIVALLLSFAFRKLVNTTSLFENDLYMPMISINYNRNVSHTLYRNYDGAPCYKSTRNGNDQ